MTTRTAVRSLDLKTSARVFLGRGKTSGVEAVGGVTITRLENGPLVEYEVTGPNVNGGTYHVDGGNVAGWVAADKPALVGKGGKAGG